MTSENKDNTIEIEAKETEEKKNIIHELLYDETYNIFQDVVLTINLVGDIINSITQIIILSNIEKEH